MSPVGTEMIDTGNAQPRYYRAVALVHCFHARGEVGPSRTLIVARPRALVLI